MLQCTFIEHNIKEYEQAYYPVCLHSSTLQRASDITTEQLIGFGRENIRSVKKNCHAMSDSKYIK